MFASPDLESAQVLMSVRTQSCPPMECYLYYFLLSFQFECIYKISMVCYELLKKIHKTFKKNSQKFTSLFSAWSLNIPFNYTGFRGIRKTKHLVEWSHFSLQYDRLNLHLFFESYKKVVLSPVSLTKHGEKTPPTSSGGVNQRFMICIVDTARWKVKYLLNHLDVSVVGLRERIVNVIIIISWDIASE